MRAFPHQEEQQMTLNELFKNTTYAKQAVEMAIEQGEDAALVWLKERSGE